MGLASKLAQAQQAPGAYGAPPGQYGQPQQPGMPGQPPYQQASQQYQAYQQPPGGQQRPPQPYGQQPPQPGYGQAPMGGAPINPAQIASILQETIRDNNLGQMFPQGTPVVDQISRSITNQVDTLCAQWKVPREVGMDLVKLALFDIIIYIDDSGSMAFEEGGERIKDLKLILSRVAFAASLFDQDGISLRFMNNDFAQNNIKTEQQITQVVDQISFKGLTPMGTSLRNKVLEPLVLAPARNRQMQKPILVITITDGQPAGEPENAVEEAILYASQELARTQYGAGAVSFQFAQVGNDLRAREYLAKLDKNPRIGHLIDCTSNYEVEADEMSRANPPVNLTVELWLSKLLLGAIDSSYDTKDEQGSRPMTGQPQQGGYPPQQGGYPPQQGGYPPQQGGYPPQQGGYPPQGAPQGQYQQRPPQGGQYQQPPPGQYGQPQGQYGQPPYGQQQQPPYR